MKFCLKLGKKATETYEMLKTAFRPSCMNRGSVFEWHKRFKEGRESLRDDERCGRNKEVSAELIEQIKNFMDKDRRVSLETISAHFDVSVGTVLRIILEELKMRKICTKFVPRVFREEQKERCCHYNRGWLSWSIQIPQFLILWWPAMKVGSTVMTQRPRDRFLSGSMLALPDPRRPDRANPPTNILWSLFWQYWHYLHTLDSQQWIPYWGFKGVQEEIPSEEASILQIGSVAFPPGQCTSPQLHPCHRLFDKDAHQDSSSPYLYSRPGSLWLLVIT